MPQKASFQDGENKGKTPRAEAQCGVSEKIADSLWNADDQNLGGSLGGV